MTSERCRERGPIFERKTLHDYNLPEDVEAVLSVLSRHPELLARR